ncbi:helix-turn-helix transcriptional regulator [Bengtsoniella intestinalis]|uniref:helix-turn-helix domain-containing protein n=1 Tax=Bengtsoniella intestinalis TaxID=3073143 RepID=UPI00391FC440
MGRVSTKENKTVYQVCREDLGLSREKAADLLQVVTPERIEKIENEKINPQPEDIMAMVTAYGAPNLCNYYCANECPIGKQYVPEIKIKELPQIVLEMLTSLNAMGRKQERLIEITVDNQIDSHEIQDFVTIQEELEKISITVETLQLWVERMLASGAIDMDAYLACKNK